MPYRISFDGAGSTAACAHSPRHAIELAELFARRGKTNVTIGCAEGDPLPIGQFRTIERRRQTLI